MVGAILDAHLQIAERSASGAEPRIRFRIGINVGESLSTATTSSVMVLTLRRVSKMSASPAVFTSLAMPFEQIRGKTRPLCGSVTLVLAPLIVDSLAFVRNRT